MKIKAFSSRLFDGNNKCFIGFTGASPPIAICGAFEYNTLTWPLMYFIDNFYDNAIVEGETIADSLNYASIQYLGTDFPSSLLNGGYYT
jgi:hypothetical protein